MILSIIIPAHNVEAYIGPCLDSVYGGSADLASYEVIVVDDGSTDGTADVIGRYAGRYGNLTVVTQESQGLSRARMNGLARARGEFIWFIDGDDWIGTDALKGILDILHQQDVASVLMTPILRYDEDPSGDGVPDYVIESPQSMEGKQVLVNGFPTWTAMRYVIRHSLFDDGRLYFPENLLHEDEYFGPVLLMLAGKVLVHDKSFYHHRMRPGSIMQSISIRSSYDLLAVYDHLKTFSASLPKSDRRWFLTLSQRMLPYCYRINEDRWDTPEFKRFKRKKGPFILAELLKNARSHSARELGSLVLLVLAPKVFRKRFPFKDPS